MKRNIEKYNVVILFQWCNSVLRELRYSRERLRREAVLQGNFHCLLCFGRHAADLESVLQRSSRREQRVACYRCAASRAEKVWSRVTPIPGGFASPCLLFLSAQLWWQVCVKQWLNSLRAIKRMQEIDCFVKLWGNPSYSNIDLLCLHSFRFLL